jgi:hypothetical protein
MMNRQSRRFELETGFNAIQNFRVRQCFAEPPAARGGQHGHPGPAVGPRPQWWPARPGQSRRDESVPGSGGFKLEVLALRLAVELED